MNKILIPPVYLLLSIVLIISFNYLLPSLNIIPYPYNLLGLILVITGFSFIFICGSFFKKYKTTHDFGTPTHLIDEGIYCRSRNPIYLGMFIFLMGLAVCQENIISLIVPFAFLFIISIVFIPFEEKKMEDAFGDQYLAYKKRVRRWI